MKLPFIKDKSKEKVQYISIDKIHTNPYQPRNNFDSNSIMELAESIKNFGIIQPLTVRKRNESEYDLIAGERRLKAAKYLDFDKVPVIIKEFNNQEMAEIALVENLQREDLDYIEEAHAYQQIIDKFSLTQKELAEKIGKSQSTVANKLRILKLPVEIQEEIKTPEISERHARALLQLTDKSQQKEVIEKIKEKELTVRETEKLIESIIAKNEEREEQVVTTVYKDLRVFTNTLNKSIKEMKEAGLEVKVNKKKKEDYIEYNIVLPREK
ncbi:MAG: nucleoid occlusion protein [Halanaerobiales bacterium]